MTWACLSAYPSYPIACCSLMMSLFLESQFVLVHETPLCLPTLYPLAKLKNTYYGKFQIITKGEGNIERMPVFNIKILIAWFIYLPPFSLAEVFKSKSKAPHSFIPTSLCIFKSVDILIPNKVIIKPNKIDNNSLGLSNSLNIMKISKLLHRSLFIIKLFKS